MNIKMLLVGALTVGTLTGAGQAAHPRWHEHERWHAEVTAVIPRCDHSTTVHFQLERLDGQQWTAPDGVWLAVVRRRDGAHGTKVIGRVSTAATGAYGTFVTTDPAAYELQVQAPDGTWSTWAHGGDLCTPVGQGQQETVS